MAAVLSRRVRTIRVTDSPQTADQQFLLTEAATKAVAQLSMDPLRGRSVWVLTEYAFSTTQPYDQAFFTNQIRSPSFEVAFMIGELRRGCCKPARGLPLRGSRRR